MEGIFPETVRSIIHIFGQCCFPKTWTLQLLEINPYIQKFATYLENLALSHFDA